MRFNQIQQANRFYYRHQILEHQRTQNNIYDFHREQLKWNSGTTQNLTKIHNDIIKGMELKNNNETSIEPYVGASLTLVPVTLDYKNGVGGLYLKGFGGKIGFRTNGEFRLGYEVSSRGSAGVGVEGSIGQDLVFSLSKPPSIETTAKAGITAGAGGQIVGIGFEAKASTGVKVTNKKTL